MNVLAVGAHWDDLEIGCGLTMHRLKKGGAKVFGVVLTDSAYRVAEDRHVRSGKDAAAEGEKVFRAVGIVHVPTTLLPNQKMTYDQPVMQELEKIARDRKVDTVFTHWFGDHNTDHAAAWEISRVAFRRVGTLLQYRSNDYFDNVKIFEPRLFIGFTKKEYELKKKLIAIHATEWKYRKARWEREIFDRERHQGYLCGCDYAEAFAVSRMTLGAGVKL